MDFSTELDQFFEVRTSLMLKDAKKEFDIEKLCFKQQIDFIRSDARYKVARCTRRSGKTTALAHYLIEECLSHRRANCVYISKTRNSAKDIVWQILKDLVVDNDLKVKVNETDLTIKFFKTESILKLYGADNLRDMEKRRGMKLRLAIIDEAQLFNNDVRTLCNDILSIALSDQQGTLCLSGTPSPSCGGFFYEKDNTEGYEKHFWSWRDNKFYINSAMENNKRLKDSEEIMLQDLKEKGQDINDPSVRREWFGEWVRSEDLMVYKYSRAKCDYKVLPNFTHYTLGIDIGSNDSDAIICWGSSTEFREAYVVEQFKKSKQNITELAHQIQRFIDKYKPYSIRMDGGGLGKKIHEELNFRYSFSIQIAEKERKFEFITLMNNDIEQGFVKIQDHTPLAEEMKILTKDEEKYRDGILKEDQRYSNDCCDAALYAWRDLYNFRFKEKPAPKTAEELLSEKIKAEKDRALERKRQTNEWGDTRVDNPKNQNWRY